MVFLIKWKEGYTSMVDCTGAHTAPGVLMTREDAFAYVWTWAADIIDCRCVIWG